MALPDGEAMLPLLSLTAWSKDRVDTIKKVYATVGTPEGAQWLMDDPALLDAVITLGRVRGSAQPIALHVLSRLTKVSALHYSIMETEGMMACLATGLATPNTAQPSATAIRNLAQTAELRPAICGAFGILTGLSQAVFVPEARQAAATALAYLSVSKPLRHLLCRRKDVCEGLSSAAATPGEAQLSAAGALLNLCGCKEGRKLLVGLEKQVVGEEEEEGVEEEEEGKGKEKKKKKEEKEEGKDDDGGDKKKDEEEEGEEFDAEKEAERLQVGHGNGEDDDEILVEDEAEEEEDESSKYHHSAVLDGLVGALLSGGSGEGKVRRMAVTAIYKLATDDVSAPAVIRRSDVLAALGVVVSTSSDVQHSAVLSLLELGCGVEKDAPLLVAKETAAITGLATAAAAAGDDVASVAARLLHVIAAEGGAALDALRAAPGAAEMLARAVIRGRVAWEDAARALADMVQHYEYYPLASDRELGGCISKRLVISRKNPSDGAGAAAIPAPRKATARALAKLVDKFLSCPFSPACDEIVRASADGSESSSSSSLLLSSLRSIAVAGDSSAASAALLLERGRKQIRVCGVLHDLSAVKLLTKLLHPSRLLQVDHGWRASKDEYSSSQLRDTVSKFVVSHWDRTAEYWLVCDGWELNMPTWSDNLGIFDALQIWKEQRAKSLKEAAVAAKESSAEKSNTEAPFGSRLVIVAPCRASSVDAWKTAIEQAGNDTDNNSSTFSVVVQLIVIPDGEETKSVTPHAALSAWLKTMLDPSRKNAPKSSSSTIVSATVDCHLITTPQTSATIGGGWVTASSDSIHVVVKAAGGGGGGGGEVDGKEEEKTENAGAAAPHEEEEEEDDEEEIVLEEAVDTAPAAAAAATPAEPSAEQEVVQEEEVNVAAVVEEETPVTETAPAAAPPVEAEEEIIVDDIEESPAAVETTPSAAEGGAFSPPWTIAAVGDAPKKAVVTWMQENGSDATLKAHKINGNRDRVAKSRSKKEIIAAYTAIVEEKTKGGGAPAATSGGKGKKK